MTTYTVIHVVISLVGIGSGVVVLFGLLTGQRLDRWTALFLASTVATSATGFGFPVDRVLPSHIVGGISLVVLAIAIYARYGRQLAGRWRTVYVVLAVVSLYLNLFVGVVQAFLRIPALRTMAPTQSEPPFVLTQLAVLALFIALSIAAVLRFRIEQVRPTSTGRVSVSRV
jgi:hypothetical protein